MTTEAEWSCPICCDSQDGIAYVSPCRHKFCLGCILRWVRRTSSCPLCRGRVEEIEFSVREENDYLKCIIPSSTRPSDASSQTGIAPRHLEEQGAVGTEARTTVGGLLPELWAELFRDHQDLLDPVLPWLRRELGAVFGEQWWLATGAESLILQALCLYGLDEEAVVRRIQPALGEHAARLVHDLMRQFSMQARRLLRSFAAGEEEEEDGHVASSSPSSSSSHSTSSSSSREETPDSYPASSSSPADSDVEEHLRTLEAALHRGPGHPPSVPVAAEQEQPQEEPEEAAVAGPSAQGDSPSPSAPGSSRRGPRRPRKRRASSPQD
ncbi:TOPRS ligase, partial [Arenaria interpres]|nr:TOPRS ligase [Arenaria interpres]